MEGLNDGQVHSMNYIQFIRQIVNYQRSLLPDKKGERYISIFNRILNLCQMNNILNRKFLPIDFEQDVILPVKLIFPNAIIKG